jgi:uncharacterized OB-fold protein
MADAMDALIRQDPATSAITLLGSRCRGCGEVLFPAMRDCPVCVEPDTMVQLEVLGHGVLRDYVISERGPDRFEVPYVQAWIKLDDGPVVFSIVETPDPRGFDVPLGSPVTMIGSDFATETPPFRAWKCQLDVSADSSSDSIPSAEGSNGG